MMMRFSAKSSAWLSLCILLAVLSLAACDDAKKAAQAPAPTIDELLATGKAALVANKYFEAEAAYLQVTAREKDNPEALYGLCLVSVEQTLAQVDLISALVATPADGDAEAEATDGETTAALTVLGETTDGDQTIPQGIDSLLDTLVTQQDAQLARIETLLAAEAPSITLDKFPIVLKGTEVFSLKHRFAKADLHLLAALSHTLRGVFGLIASQNLGDLNEHISELSTLFGGQANLARVLPAMLQAYPKLLTLRQDGPARFAAARDDLKAAAGEMLLAADGLSKETGNTDDRVFAAVKVKEVANLAVRGSYPTSKKQLLLLWAGTNYSLQETFTRIVAHLSGDAEQRLRGDKDVTVLLAVLLDAVRQSITLEAGAAMLGLTLPESLTSTLAMVKDDQGERLPNALFLALNTQFKLKTAAIELDLLSFFSRPIDLRELLPAMIAEDPIAKKPMWLKSPECPLAGFSKTSAAPGDTLSLFLFDESLIGQTAPTLSVTSYADNDPTKIQDSVTALPLTAVPGVTGLYMATLQTASGTPTSGDQTLSFSSSARLRLTSGGDSPALIADVAPGALPPADLAGSCDPLATPVDRPHFASSLFAQVGQLPDPPAAAKAVVGAYPGYPADTLANAWPMLAWPSPSMNGLLWLDVPNLPLGSITGCPSAMAKSTACSFQALLGGVEKVAAGFSQ